MLVRIHHRATRRDLAPKRVLLLGRVLSAAFLVSAALMAPDIERRFGNIYTAIQSMFSLVQGPSLAILLLGVLWRRATSWGGLAGLGERRGARLYAQPRLDGRPVPLQRAVPVRGVVVVRPRRW